MRLSLHSNAWVLRGALHGEPVVPETVVHCCRVNAGCISTDLAAWHILCSCAFLGRLLIRLCMKASRRAGVNGSLGMQALVCP